MFCIYVLYRYTFGCVSSRCRFCIRSIIFFDFTIIFTVLFERKKRRKKYFINSVYYYYSVSRFVRLRGGEGRGSADFYGPTNETRPVVKLLITRSESLREKIYCADHPFPYPETVWIGYSSYFALIDFVLFFSPHTNVIPASERNIVMLFLRKLTCPYIDSVNR